MKKTIDLRSDTVTRPCAAMREVMKNAPVGDDVMGDDPSVNQLESMVAEKLGTEAALFCSSGTQSNLLGLMTHCQRGDEYIVGQEGHTYKFEGGGAAVLGSIQPQPLDFKADATFDLDKVKEVIKPDDSHYARTRLLCLENTHLGKIVPLDYFPKVKEFVDTHGLRLHLDGARLFNASEKLGIEIKEITQYCDSISVCLSKGLGAPVGSLLCGSKEQIKEARRWRKVLGGGMRQAGILAAAGIYALEHNIPKLSVDHEHAELLGKKLSEINELSVELETLHTNMVFFTTNQNMNEELVLYLKEKDILILGGSSIRLATHLDITEEDIGIFIDAVKNFIREN